jgi:hypothetical protein
MPASKKLIVTLADPRAELVKALSKWVYVAGDRRGDPPDGMRRELMAIAVGKSRRPSR